MTAEIEDQTNEELFFCNILGGTGAEASRLLVNVVNIEDSGVIIHSGTSPSRVEHSLTSSEQPPPGYYQTVTQIFSFMHSFDQQMQDFRGIMSNIEDRLSSLERTGSTIEELRVSHFNVAQMDNLLASLQPFGIMIPERATVQAYLVSYPDMVELLPLVCQLARNQVGDDTQLSLGVYTDPEGGKGHLSLYIRPERYTDGLFKTINKIEEEYIGKLVGKSGWIVVTTDFQDPK